MPLASTVLAVPTTLERGASIEDVVIWASAFQRAMIEAFRQRDAAGGQTYIVTNLNLDRTFDADSILIGELADVVGTLISDLRDRGLLS